MTNSLTQFSLGLMYRTGTGVPKDSNAAVFWFRKAAAQGYVPAQSCLGYMYAAGEGVPRDEIEGLAWTYIAASSGDKIAVKNRELGEVASVANGR